jgi:hypothetical protein
MRDKQAITQALIRQYPESQRPGLEWAMKTWWRNMKPQGGMRLSIHGFMAMQRMQVEHYNFMIDLDQVRPKLLVMLDQRLQDPYYLQVDKREPCVKFYGSKEAFMANLYGDLEKFLENYTDK